MKVLFLQSRSLWVELIGVMHLSSALKRAGHEVALALVEDEAEIGRVLSTERPHVVGLSAMTGGHRWSLAAARATKKHNRDITTILGGPHATFFPQVAMAPEIDFAVIGESEEALVRLLDALPVDRPNTLSNLAWSEEGRLRTSAPAPLVESLDDIGMADRDLYPDLHEYFAWHPVKSFMASRGCPYTCSYCFNHSFHELYRGRGSILRHHSIDHVLAEIQHVRERYSLRTVRFEDSNINLDREWLLEFLERYRNSVGLPFVCNVSIGLVDRETANALAAANCEVASFGLETGSEELRRALGKRVGNEEMRRGARFLKQAGIRLNTTNMFGLPGESIDDALSTIRLNRELAVDYPFALIFQPYPGLELTRRAVEAGILDLADVEEIGSSFDSSVLRSENIDQLVNLQRLFYLVLRLPWLEGIVQRLVKLPPNAVFKLLHDVFYAITVFRKNPLSLSEFVRYTWRHRRFQRRASS